MDNLNVNMFLANAYRPDIRVEKEATTLNEIGYPVTITAWDRLGEMTPAETRGSIRIQRIQKIRTKYGGGIRQLLHTPRFWREAIKIGRLNNPRIVHCHDLDTLYIGVRLKQQLNCKIIYDAHEDYPALMSLYLPHLAIRPLMYWERILMRYADGIITASSVLADKYTAAGFSNITNVPNVHDLNLFDSVSDEASERTRLKLNLEPGKLIITYIGGFSRNRLLLPLIEAAGSLENTTLLIFGDGHQREEVDNAVRKTSNCHYLGWLPPGDIPVYMRISDIVYYCLKPDYPGAIYNAPNTLAYAMASGRPIIANNLGDLGRIVTQAECGVLLEKVDAGSVKSAVEKLRDPKLREILGQNGRRYANREYNWASASKKLAGLYQHILK